MDEPKNISNDFFVSRSSDNYVSINHWIGSHNEIPLFYMLEGYKKSTLILLEIISSSEEWLTKDSLVYPMLFNFRHYLEISMKDTLRYYRISNREINSCGVGFKTEHKLLEIWKELKQYLPHNEDFSKLECLLMSFDAVDHMSFSFRYPFDNPAKGEYSSKAKFIIDGVIRADLDELSNNIKYLLEIFEGINLCAATLLD